MISFLKAAIPQIGLVAGRGTFAYNIFFRRPTTHFGVDTNVVFPFLTRSNPPNQVNARNEAGNIRSQRSGWHFIIAITKMLSSHHEPGLIRNSLHDPRLRWLNARTICDYLYLHSRRIYLPNHRCCHHRQVSTPIRYKSGRERYQYNFSGNLPSYILGQ